MKIDIARLRKDIEELGQIGRDPNGGVSRPSFSKADLEEHIGICTGHVGNYDLR